MSLFRPSLLFPVFGNLYMLPKYILYVCSGITEKEEFAMSYRRVILLHSGLRLNLFGAKTAK
jgi:hypothetical protein